MSFTRENVLCPYIRGADLHVMLMYSANRLYHVNLFRLVIHGKVVGDIAIPKLQRTAPAALGLRQFPALTHGKDTNFLKLLSWSLRSQLERPS